MNGSRHKRGEDNRNGKDNMSCKYPLLEAATVLAPPLETYVSGLLGLLQRLLRGLSLDVVHGTRSWCRDAVGGTESGGPAETSRCAAAWWFVVVLESWCWVGALRTYRYFRVVATHPFSTAHFSLARRFPAEFPETYVRAKWPRPSRRQRNIINEDGVGARRSLRGRACRGGGCAMGRVFSAGLSWAVFSMGAPSRS